MGIASGNGAKANWLCELPSSKTSQHCARMKRNMTRERLQKWPILDGLSPLLRRSTAEALFNFLPCRHCTTIFGIFGRSDEDSWQESCMTCCRASQELIIADQGSFKFFLYISIITRSFQKVLSPRCRYWRGIGGKKAKPEEFRLQPCDSGLAAVTSISITRSSLQLIQPLKPFPETTSSTSSAFPLSSAP